MTFTIPNEAAASFPAQATLDSTDFAIILAGHQQIGVLSGAGVTSASSTTVTVAAGVVQSGLSTAYAITSTTLTVGSGGWNAIQTSGGDRRDLIVYRPGTGILVLNGTASVPVSSGNPTGTDPVKTAITAGDVALAEVYIPQSAASLTSANLVDKSVSVGGSGHNIVVLAGVGTTTTQAQTTATWVKPTGPYTRVKIILLGAAGGGGGGATAGASLSGGAGGAGGSYATFDFPLSAVGSTATLAAGIGGAGGAVGAAGSTGGISSFSDSGFFNNASGGLIADSGGGGASGSATASTGGAPNSGQGLLSTQQTYNGVAGSSGPLTGAAVVPALAPGFAGGGGGAGAGSGASAGTGPTKSLGGFGSALLNGTIGGTNNSSVWAGGNGGTGPTGGGTGAAGAAAVGKLYGGGGSGGATAFTGGTSSAGAAGAVGLVVVICS